MGVFDDLIPSAEAKTRSTSGPVGAFDDLIPRMPREAPVRGIPNIGKPEELTLMEKLATTFLPDSLGDANIRGSAVGRVAKGLSDPGVAIAQTAANAVGMGDGVNKAVADREAEYQAARKAAGSEGFDPLRVGGNLGMEAMMVAATPLKAIAAAPTVRAGATMGGASGALQPVVDTSDGFWTEKAKDTGLGAVTGGVLSPVFGALARVVSPNASTDAGLKLLRDEGINPTIGQAAGGWANKAEQAATSLPVVGPMIAGARRKSFEDFNEAMANRAVAPVGGKIKGSGHEAVAEAGDMLSKAYQDAVADLPGISLSTPVFTSRLQSLEGMANGLMPGLREKFTSTIDNVIGRRVSPNGSLLGSDIKAVDSELGKIARDWRGSSTASEREFGDAVFQLKTELMDAVRASNPDVARKLKDADKGWAWLTRVENASKKAMNQDGIYTPGQWNQAVREGDKSPRKRATARGEAMGQDVGSAAQRILGNTVPDSGSASRLLQAMGILGAGAIHPGIVAGGAIAAGAYTKPVQNTLVRILAERPEAAPRVANYLRSIAPRAALAAGPMMREFE